MWGVGQAEHRKRAERAAKLEEQLIGSVWVAQTAMMLVLEPIFETNFDRDSYGFRPGKSAQDALSEIQRSITFQDYREVADIDLKSYFDTIHHSILLELVGRRVSDRRVLRLIRMWLTARVLDEGKLQKQVTGTPQGGCITPGRATAPPQGNSMNPCLHYSSNMTIMRAPRKSNHR